MWIVFSGEFGSAFPSRLVFSPSEVVTRGIKERAAHISGNAVRVDRAGNRESGTIGDCIGCRSLNFGRDRHIVHPGDRSQINVFERDPVRIIRRTICRVDGLTAIDFRIQIGVGEVESEARSEFSSQ